jgi:hypothetical protein
MTFDGYIKPTGASHGVKSSQPTPSQHCAATNEATIESPTLIVKFPKGGPRAHPCLYSLARSLAKEWLCIVFMLRLCASYLQWKCFTGAISCSSSTTVLEPELCREWTRKQVSPTAAFSSSHKVFSRAWRTVTSRPARGGLQAYNMPCEPGDCQAYHNTNNTFYQLQQR